MVITLCCIFIVFHNYHIVIKLQFHWAAVCFCLAYLGVNFGMVPFNTLHDLLQDVMNRGALTQFEHKLFGHFAFLVASWCFFFLKSLFYVALVILSTPPCLQWCVLFGVLNGIMTFFPLKSCVCFTNVLQLTFLPRKIKSDCSLCLQSFVATVIFPQEMHLSIIQK